MPRSCSICSSKHLQEINAALLLGTPYRDISEQFHVSVGSLSRHRQHMVVPESQVKAVQRLKAEEIAASTTGNVDVFGQAKDLGERAKRLLDECQTDKDRKHEIAAMREARGLLELQSRLMGLLGPSTAVQVNTALIQDPNPVTQPLPPEAARRIGDILAEYL